MPATPTLTLSQVESLDTAYLRDAADHWERTANHWEESFTAVHSRISTPGGTVWTGFGSQGALGRSYADMVKVREPADVLNQASRTARRGEEALQACKHGVLDAVREARDDEFYVGEDFSVIDRRQGGSEAYLAERQIAAQGHASFIRQRVGALHAKDHEIGTQLATVSAGVEGLTFQDEPAPTGSGDRVSDQPRSDTRRPAVQLAGWGHKGMPLAPSPAPGPTDPFPPGPEAFGGGAEPLPPTHGPLPQIGPIPVLPEVAAAVPKDAPPIPTYRPRVPAPPVEPKADFGQCVKEEFRENIGINMVKDGFKSAGTGALGGAATGAGLGAVVSPELGGAGAVPGGLAGGVLGFVGGFTKGLITAPAKTAAEAALDCAK
ncbi:hypothetical protein [[Mycobacterium] vasticus]|uniref:ESX-1 secretion-associated protein EspA/EspE-like domain-containing protein n=1 Tax=[Mycobacterium] vasticus TaxID=2875777 RepID=A0ABU5Z0C9_9MYCO|nr:hypothetical protein [Mycolicibacter sp. MYC017]MEB3070856.1 hypothetical protein [Mycolicibacter sp. MYC017]